MFTPAPDKKILRRMGYISDQEGIMRRYLREANGWNEHLRNSARFIIDSINETDTDNLVVLGSGWLLDFPIGEIPSRVRKISLVDVNFPSLVIKKVKDMKGVECITADITGGYIEMIYNLMKAGAKNFRLPSQLPVPRISPEKGKMILSLNLMNQLDILLVDYLQKFGVTDDSLIMNLRKNLQSDHINMLKDHPFILITDYMEVLMNSRGKIVEEKDLIHVPFPGGDRSAQWAWLFDTNRLYNSHADTLLKVKAVFSKPL